MLAYIKIGIVVVILATGGVGYLYVQKLQSDLQTARANVAKMEVAVATAEASIATLQQDAAKMAELNNKLSSDLQKAEAYGDDLRGKLQRHNLTALALKEPGQLEGKMNGATAKLWRSLEQDTGGAGDDPLPSWLQRSPPREAGTGSESGDTDPENDSTDGSSAETN
jgi:FtsZ-binding cell division protein ZapB